MAMVLVLLIHYLLMLRLIVGDFVFCPCFVIQSLCPSSFAITLMGIRDIDCLAGVL